MVLRIAAFGLLLALTACGETPETTPLGETQEAEVSADEARALYVLHCEACHGMDGKKGNSNAADLSVSELDDQKIKSVILNGNDEGMMPFKDVITSDKQVNAIVEYVKKLRK